VRVHEPRHQRAVAEIDSLDFGVNEETSDLSDSNGDMIDTFVTKRVIEGTLSLKAFSASLIAIATRGVTVTANRPLGYTHATTIPTTPFGDRRSRPRRDVHHRLASSISLP
jgi:hypothetical protein